MGSDNVRDYEELRAVARVIKGDEEFAVNRIEPHGRSELEPILGSLTEERVLAVVADVTGIPVARMRSRVRGGPTAAARRCLAGDAGRRLAGISLAAMARSLGREESYLLKGVSTLERAVERASVPPTRAHPAGTPRGEIRISG